MNLRNDCYQELSLSDTITESGVKFDYWDLQFTELTMTSSVDLTKDPSMDKLLVSH